MLSADQIFQIRAADTVTLTKDAYQSMSSGSARYEWAVCAFGELARRARDLSVHYDCFVAKAEMMAENTKKIGIS